MVGLDNFNLEKLRRLPEAKECEFLPAVKLSEIRGIKNISIQDLPGGETRVKVLEKYHDVFEKLPFEIDAKEK